MSKIKVLQIVKGTGPDKVESLKLLPGTFDHDQAAMKAIKEKGEYLFLEVHTVKPFSKEKEKEE